MIKKIIKKPNSETKEMLTVYKLCKPHTQPYIDPFIHQSL